MVLLNGLKRCFYIKAFPVQSQKPIQLVYSHLLC